MVYNMTEPTEALDFWLNTFNTIYDKHAPYKKERVKSVPKPKWFNTELQEAIYFRDLANMRNQTNWEMLFILKKALQKRNTSRISYLIKAAWNQHGQQYITLQIRHPSRSNK